MPVSSRPIRIARWCVRTAVACGASVPLVTVHPARLAAQAAGGAVAGRVADSSGTPVPGAMIYIAGTRYGAVTGDDGRYRVSAIPAGSYAMHVRRIGFAADSFRVRIATGAIERNVILRAVASSIAGVQITAARPVDTPEATVEQIKQAPTIENVVGAKTIEALPNANAADVAARLPGVTTERDEGESKFIEIRGTEPRLSNVMVDGVHVPGTEQGERNPKLDDVPSALLGELTVDKTLTADMDADAIGGTVNLVTRVPEGPPHGSVSAEAGAITLLGRETGDATLIYGGRVGHDERFGFLLSASYDRNDRAINDLEPTWSSTAGGVHFYPGEFSLQADEYERTRYGVGGGVDYRLSPSTTLFVKGLYSLFLDHGSLYVFDVGNGQGAPVAGSRGSSGVDTGATLYRMSQALTPTEQLYSTVLGGTTAFRHDTLSYRVNIGGTSRDVTGFRASPFYYNAPASYRFNYSNPNVPLYSGLAPSAMSAAQYSLGGYTDDDTRSRASTYGVRFDYAAPHVVTGFRIRSEDSHYVDQSYSATYTGPTLPLSDFVSGFHDPGFYSAIHPLALGPVPDDAAVRAYENAHPGLFARTIDTLANALGSFSGSERVYAGYTMYRADVGRASLNAGLRLEVTDGSYVGHGAAGNQTYADLFPSAQVKFQLDDATDLRVAGSRAIGRPNFSDLAPSVSGLPGDPATIVMIGNPNLRPEYSWNLDLLGERFLDRAGVLSAGLFYKNVSNFIFVHSIPGYRVAPFNDGPNYRAGQPENGSAGTLLGAEAEWNQRLTFLPGVLSGLGFDVNGALTTSWATIDDRRVRLPRQAPALANTALVYEKGPIELRAAWAYQAANIVSYGDGTSNPATGDQYFYSHGQVDASIEWKPFRDTEIELEGTNLNDAVFGFYAGTPHQHYSFQREYYGQTFAVSVKRSF